MLTNRISSVFRAAPLALIAGLLLVSCERSATEEELPVDITGLSVSVVKDAAELNQDFVLVFAVLEPNFANVEARLKFAISRAQAEGVDALIIGTESRGPDMGDCVFDGKEKIQAGTMFGVRYVAESDREEYRRQKRSCAVKTV